jgi:prepilin-type N-terminal cleavage/methylation domain-containing protein
MNKNKKNGFTLAETITTISILAVISTVLVTFYITGLKIYKEKSIERDLIFATENTLKDISASIKSTTNFINQKELNGITYISNSDTIILEIPSIDSDNKTIYENNQIIYFDYIVYTRSGNNIEKSVYPSTVSIRSQLENKILESGVTNFLITYHPVNPPVDWATITKVNFLINAEKNTGTVVKQIQLDQTIKSRNQ